MDTITIVLILLLAVIISGVAGRMQCDESRRFGRTHASAGLVKKKQMGSRGAVYPATIDLASK